jgi:hypothetical protein
LNLALQVSVLSVHLVVQKMLRQHMICLTTCTSIRLLPDLGLF